MDRVKYTLKLYVLFLLRIIPKKKVTENSNHTLSKKG